MYKKIKIQIISRTFPLKNNAGRDAYILDFVNYLRQVNCEVEYVSINPSATDKYPWCIIPSTLGKPRNVRVRNNLQIGRILLRFNVLSDWIAGPLRLIFHKLPQRLKNIFRLTIQKFKKKSNQLINKTQNLRDWQDVLATSEEIAFAKTQIDRFKPDVIVVNYIYLAKILDILESDKNILKAILTHDVFHQRNALFQKIGVVMGDGNWNLEAETAQLEKAQVLLAIQKEDAQIFKQMVPQARVINMPISAMSYSHNIKQVPGRCLFVGSRTEHNNYGLQWFLENVWLQIIEKVPHCSLHVCGSVCDGIQESFPNVRFLGRVNDLQPEYSAAEVCLVPLLAGSGLKIKLVEAMSYSRACVSTSVGIQGLPEIAGKTAIVADTVDDFVAAMHTLLTDSEKRQWMERQAYKYVKENLSSKSSYQPFVDYIHQYFQQQAEVHFSQK
ncbi:MAG: glycosyltransferase [Nostocales cyanobacterium 94392]|nr:glycosyltransferase [Nostocales cyanobacterium 94392]